MKLENFARLLVMTSVAAVQPRRLSSRPAVTDADVSAGAVDYLLVMIDEAVGIATLFTDRVCSLVLVMWSAVLYPISRRRTGACA